MPSGTKLNADLCRRASTLCVYVTGWCLALCVYVTGWCLALCVYVTGWCLACSSC